VTFLLLSTRFCISRLLLGTSKEVSRFPEFTPSTGIFFHDEEFMGAYVTDRSTLPVAAAASSSNGEPTKTSIYSPGPSTSKEETHPSFLEYIRFLPTAGPRKSQNVNKMKRTTVILTDTSDKMLWKSYNARLGANEKNWAQEKRKEKGVQHSK